MNESMSRDIVVELSTIERAELGRYEAVIKRGLEAFVAVGNALLAIRRDHLYRGTHSTFEAYVDERWRMTYSYANKLIGAAEVVGNLTTENRTIVHVLPQTESQARPLTKLPPDQQREVWREAVETAPKGKVTAAHVQSVVDEYQMQGTFFTPEDNAGQETIAPSGHPPSRVRFWQSSETNEWYTPSDIIRLVHVALGGIDLDPASSEMANAIVGARQYFTQAEDGLRCDWRGHSVFCNPPYGKDSNNRSWAAIWAGKMYQEYVASHFTEGILLLPVNKFQFEGVQLLMALPNRRVFHPNKRIDYVSSDNGKASGANFPSMLVYVGPRPDHFTRTFWHLGIVDQQATLGSEAVAA